MVMGVCTVVYMWWGYQGRRYTGVGGRGVGTAGCERCVRIHVGLMSDVEKE